jgi:serine/threonine protein kinase
MDYLVMECVEGETLARRLEKGPLSLEQAIKFGMQIADALDKAHRSGVVHRDLKPGNIMLTPTPKPKLFQIPGSCSYCHLASDGPTNARYITGS